MTGIPTLKGLTSLFNTDHAELSKLKAANDNLISETTTLKAQLRAANDKQKLLERRLERLERAK